MTSPKDKQTSLPGKQGGQNTPGTVYLVGAGPGHPGLLTRRGAEILGFAQVVAYDRLVSPEVLALASPQAEMIVVGRRQGQDPGVPGMHPIVLEKSLQGLSVARLKSGDPFIFGRGAEELDDLLSAHIPFEVVPGVSAALGAAAYAGIPLTHRKLASDVTLVTGHDGESGLSSQAQWDHLARGTGTLVLYMAARRLGPNVRRLIEAGRKGATPACYIAGASWPGQKVVAATLETLETRVLETLSDRDQKLPALLIVGGVAGLYPRYSWTSARPLNGKRVVVARARPGGSKLADRLTGLGASVLELPRITAARLDSYQKLDELLDQCLGSAPGFWSVVFGCREGVEAVLGRLSARGDDIRKLGVPLTAVGVQAADALRRAGLQPALETPGHCGPALKENQFFLKGHRLLVITGERGRPALMRELRQLGADPLDVAAYRVETSLHSVGETAMGEGSLETDLVILPSSSAARALLSGDWVAHLQQVPALTYGPHTTQAARDLGLEQVHQAADDKTETVAALARRLLGEQPPKGDAP